MSQRGEGTADWKRKKRAGGEKATRKTGGGGGVKRLTGPARHGETKLHRGEGANWGMGKKRAESIRKK